MNVKKKKKLYGKSYYFNHFSFLFYYILTFFYVGIFSTITYTD